MSYATTAFKRLCPQSAIVFRQRTSRSFFSSRPELSSTRNISYSAVSSNSFRQPDFGARTNAAGRSPVPRTQKISERTSNRAALHVSNIPPETTDEEFKRAFSVLPGLVDTHLVFNSGPLRDHQGTTNRGFGFLHFENSDAANAAAKHMREAPVRLQGQATEINPYKAVIPPPNQPTHVLLVNGVSLDLQYLEIVELLKEVCPYFKSVRFMAGKAGTFLGVATIAFENSVAATRAKEALLNSNLGGVLLREHNIIYGRPLFEEYPTNTLLVLGTTKDAGEAYELRKHLEEFDFIERFKLMKDLDTNEYKGFTIIGCDSVANAWKLLEWFNREYPQCRGTFIVSRDKYNRGAEPSRTRGNRLRSYSEGDQE